MLHVAATEIRFDQQARVQELLTAELTMTFTTFGSDDLHFMERVQAAIMEQDPTSLLLTLLEATSGHAYTEGESLEPGERTPNDPRYPVMTGNRAIDVGD